MVLSCCLRSSCSGILAIASCGRRGVFLRQSRLGQYPPKLHQDRCEIRRFGRRVCATAAEVSVMYLGGGLGDNGSGLVALCIELGSTMMLWWGQAPCVPFQEHRNAINYRDWLHRNDLPNHSFLKQTLQIAHTTRHTFRRLLRNHELAFANAIAAIDTWQYQAWWSSINYHSSG